MKTFTSELDYINEVSLPAQKACKRYGYLPSVLIAQSCLENGFGIRDYWDNPEIEKLMEVNNVVGIKSQLLNDSWSEYTVWNHKSITKNTPEEYSGKMVTIKDDFRMYDSIEQSFCDFLLFLTYASNYGKGGKPKYGEEVLSIKDPETLIKRVSSLGYATGSTYPTSVMRIVNKHNLTRFDDLTNVEPSMIVPDSLKLKYGLTGSTISTADIIIPTANVKKLEDKKINDITAENRNEVPASRGEHSIEFIVCHYLGVPNADNPYLYGGGYGGHYNIKRNGQIFKAADPRTAVVWQCGGGLQGPDGHDFYKICTNYNSIGIECGVCYAGTEKEPSGESDKWFFTEETQESLVYLVSKLMDEYDVPFDHVIRHYDVTGKICPNPYVRNNGLNGNWTWREFKTNLLQYRKDGTITVPPRNGVMSTGLFKGDKGEAVKTMQTMLIACGYDCGTAGADGDFGNKTLGALKAFQLDKNLDVSGIYTDEVKSLLEKEYNSITATTKDSKQEIQDSNTVYNGVDYKYVYNYTYYRKKYADLQKAFGKDKARYFEHFCLFGMKEGRKASPNFSVQAYQRRYADLRSAFGDNLPMYYWHYCVYGRKENRKAT